MTLEEGLRRGRQNNFDALRLFAAAAVVISHAWPLALGPGAVEPLQVLTGHSLGAWSVALFFFLSGFFIAGSAAKRPPAQFWLHRVARLMPGLCGALFLGFLLAVASGGRADPVLAAEYLLRGITLVSIEHNLPGAWPGNPWPEAVNGPLWSLFYEVVAYALAFAAIRTGLLRLHRAPEVFLAFALVLSVSAPKIGTSIPRVEVFAPLWLAFSMGVVAWTWREKITLRWDFGVLAWGLFIVIGGWTLGVVAIGYTALLLAWRVPASPLPADLSYGVYIYGWPVAQLVVHLLGPMTPAALSLFSIVAVVPLAFASWHLFEAPALSAVRRRVRLAQS